MFCFRVTAGCARVTLGRYVFKFRRGLSELYEIPGILPGLAECKTNVTTILSFWSLKFVLVLIVALIYFVCM